MLYEIHYKDGSLPELVLTMSARTKFEILCARNMARDIGKSYKDGQKNLEYVWEENTPNGLAFVWRMHG